MPRHDAGLSPAVVESIAGLTAGSVATLTVHPLDIVKTRMQSTSGISRPGLGNLWVPSFRLLTSS